MQRLVRWVSVLCLLGAAGTTGQAAAAGPALSLKAGETADGGPVYAVKNCRNILKGDPTAQVMEGPADVTVSLKKGDVTPTANRCTKAVQGGTLVIMAPKEVKARSEGKLVVRLKFPTAEGERQTTRIFQITLFP